MAIFLYKHSTVEEVDAKFEYSLINLNGKKNYVRTGHNHTFDGANSVAWGWDTFIEQQELHDLGFVKDDAILVKVYVEILES